jgi:U3 small nucleolar RNA-associated protein 23
MYVQYFGGTIKLRKPRMRLAEHSGKLADGCSVRVRARIPARIGTFGNFSGAAFSTKTKHPPYVTMKLKRAKVCDTDARVGQFPANTILQAYKKLLHQYELNFGFREPYQVLLDSQILEDAYRFKIDLVARLQKMLGGQVKPMITTCDMRHLYNAKPKNETLILQAKEYERRRCNHQDLEEPLSTLECLCEVVDPKGSGTNKNRYIVASNDTRVRGRMRAIAGVPTIYISKSVVLMEPMAQASEQLREREEKSKFKMGLKGQRKPDQAPKRKRDDDEEDQGAHSIAEGDAQPTKKKRAKGPKQPNPLSMKKAKNNKPSDPTNSPKKSKPAETSDARPTEDTGAAGESSGRKRKRKHKSKADGDAAPADGDAGSP